MFKAVPALSLVAAALLIAGCEARFGNDAGPIAENATAEGRAEDGQVSIEAPGFNMSIAIPEGVRSHVTQDRDGLIPPGARIAGVHVQGRPSTEGRDGGGDVEIRFTTAEPVDRVAAWYRQGAGSAQLRAATVDRDGPGYRLTGSGRDGENFTLRLTPGEGGGTTGRLLMGDHR